MEFASNNDYRLLRNIISIKKILLESKTQSHKSDIEIYSNLIHLLNSGNIQEVNKIMSSSTSSLDFFKFKENISQKSNRKIATEYVDIIKSFGFPDKKFHEFLAVFFKNNENLNTYHYFTGKKIDTTQLYLKNINRLLKNTTKKSTPTEFKNFSKLYAINAKKIANEIYKNYFKNFNQKLINISIYSGKNNYDVSTYVTDLTFSTNLSNDINYLRLEENAPPSGFASTYYQNLCLSYIEPYNCCIENDDYITPEYIISKTNNFRKYYNDLKSMLNCKIVIANGKLLCYAETHKTPGEQSDNNNINS